MEVLTIQFHFINAAAHYVSHVPSVDATARVRRRPARAFFCLVVRSDVALPFLPHSRRRVGAGRALSPSRPAVHPLSFDGVLSRAARVGSRGARRAPPAT